MARPRAGGLPGRGQRDQLSVSVGIVGAGFGGLGTGARLKQQGIAEFTIFERGETVGGVWRANTYPGAAVDVPTHLYSFSFARGDHWTRRFAPQAEILAYLERVADDFGLRPHLRLETEVESARFDDRRGKWTLVAGGEEHEFDVLVAACGQLTNPNIPAVPGIEAFGGTSFHSAEWDHDHDLAGERVAVIGTGASAIQFVPEIAGVPESITVYQRSAPWIVPKNDRPYADWERRVFNRFPPRVAASRFAEWAVFEVAAHGFTGTDPVMDAIARLADYERARAVKDPVLREAVTPDYSCGCKRVLITSDWYPALQRPDVELVAGGVQRITATGVVGADGVERPADTIIWGTGFATHDFIAPMRIAGPDGRELGEAWAERPEAYLGMTVSGFPNLFVLYGPNTNHGSGSVVFTLESQFNYVLDAVRRMEERNLAWIDLKPSVQAAWRDEIAERSRKTRWVTGGCTSWYVNGEGVNTNNWPGAWMEYRRRTRRLNPADYRAARA